MKITRASTTFWKTWFGDGSDGDVTVSTSITLTRDMYYRNLTLVAGAAIKTNGLRVFVSQTLDITQAPSGALSQDGVSGANAAITVGGGAAAARTTGSWGAGGGAPGTGPNGGTTTGTVGGANTAFSTALCYGGRAGTTGGAGGTGSSGAGGLVGTDNAAAVRAGTFRYPAIAVPAFIEGIPSPSAGSGGGDGTAGGGAGTGGYGGGGLFVAAATILRATANANAGVFTCKGGNGGGGGVPAGGNRGGGGGAPGAGGGNIYILYGALSGTAQANAIDVSGGGGGTGGVGVGTGTAGQGGQAGFGGVAQVICLSTGTCTVFDGRALGGNANAGATGGTSTTAQASL